MTASPLSPSDRALIIYEFDLPEELVALGDKYVKKSVGLVKLTASQEIKASENAATNQVRLAYAFLRMSLVEVDGRRIDKSVGEEESIVENCDQQIRELMTEAYVDISGNKAGVTKKFLGSRKVKTG